MQIIKYDGTEKDWKLFKRKKGQHDWEWQDCGYYSLTNKGLIDLTIFLQKDEIQIFKTFDEYYENQYEIINENLNQKNFTIAIKTIEKCQEIEIDFEEDKNIIIYDNLNVTSWIENRYVESYTDDNSYEWRVGIPD